MSRGLFYGLQTRWVLRPVWEHAEDCTRPPMRIQQPVVTLFKRLGHCPECGAAKVFPPLKNSR